ncbi:hypothetical protein [Wenzhouxiangella marina]|uniref:Uncharacterized protein n=1 Tax=Wenzhouxiangella marina TaxID=1579979 RepID=A0A0K0XSQ2_9GAMM|nr:hypothetical protein [Wenzhouxiangella marina]AKS40662.1 hypothetical protein WM2015_275 [Wenzhouxiangella marina]MBB6088432.1 hypothetical protein [Wenzhouxiangella marina]
MNTSDSRQERLAGFDELPMIDPPPALWSAIRTELDQRAASRRHRRLGWISSGLAAAAVLVVLLGVLNSPELPMPASGEPMVADATDPALVQARQISALLESRLRQQNMGAINTSSVERLVYVENELHWLDIRLASQPDNLDLWQRRVELLDEMNRLYGRNNWQTEMQLTSF